MSTITDITFSDAAVGGITAKKLNKLRDDLEVAIGSGGGGTGTGDMTKAVYDTDNNGKVDTCDSLAWGKITGAPAFAPLASPTFTGDPKAPTPALGDNDTSVATTAYVTTAIADLADVYVRWVPYTGPPQSFLNQDMTRDGDWTMVANKNTSDRPAPSASGPEEDLLPSWIPATQNAPPAYTIYNEWTINTAGWIDQYGVDVLTQNAGKATHTISLAVNGVTKDSLTVTPNNAGIFWQNITPLMVLSGNVLRVTAQISQSGNNYWYQQTGLFATAPTYCSSAVGAKDGATAGTTAYGAHLLFQPGTKSPDWDVVAYGGAAAGGGGSNGDMLKSVYDTNADNIVDHAALADSAPWTGITGKPTTFPPDSTAMLKSVYDTNANNVVDTCDSLAWGKLTGVPATFPPDSTAMLKATYDTNGDGISDHAALADAVPWTGITGKPSTFPPDSTGMLKSVYDTNANNVVDTCDSLAWAKLTGVPATFPPDSTAMLKATYDTNTNGVVDTCDSLAWAKLTGVPATFPPDSTAMLKSVYDTNADNIVDHAALADGAPWTGITGKPTAFAPSAHASTHLDNGTDPIPVATASRTGSLRALNGTATTFLDGTGNWSTPAPSGTVNPGTWTNLTYSTGWTQNTTAQYRVETNGSFQSVICQGIINYASGVAALAFTLPAGARPGVTRGCALAGFDSTGDVQLFQAVIATSGAVNIYPMVRQNFSWPSATSGSVYLDSLSFAL